MCYIAIIFLGYILRQKGFFGPEAFGVLSKILMKITLPCAVIASNAGKSIDTSMLTVVLLSFGAGVIYMILGAIIYRNKGKDAQAFGILNIPGYNIGTPIWLSSDTTVILDGCYMRFMDDVKGHGISEQLDHIAYMFNVRTRGKKYENFIINAIYTKVGNPDLIPVTQQYVRDPNDSNKYYLLDLYIF